MASIAVIVPTYNEEQGIGEVIDRFPDEAYGMSVDIYVIDGSSTDRTQEVASVHGATVIQQTYEGGKGSAVQEAFDRIDADIYVTIDGDDTYPAQELATLIKPIVRDNASQVIGCRKYLESGSMDTVNYLGNIIFSKMASMLHRNEDVDDILSGYRAISREKVEEIDIKSSGFDIETELTMLSMANGGIVNIHMDYYKRAGETKLNPFIDGIFVLGRMLETRVRTLGYHSS